MAKSKAQNTSHECITSVIHLKRCQNLDNKAQYETYIYLTKMPHKENMCTIINKVTFPDILIYQKFIVITMVSLLILYFFNLKDMFLSYHRIIMFDFFVLSHWLLFRTKFQNKSTSVRSSWIRGYNIYMIFLSKLNKKHTKHH